MSSQFNEDAVLADLFKDVPSGTYIDVGAHHPIHLSNTWALYQRGWRGITIEPCEAMYNEQKRVRPEDTHLQVAISNMVGHMTFYECGESSVSTIDKAVAKDRREAGQQIKEYSVRVMPLSDVVMLYSEHPFDAPDLLSIDVEGHERKVLKSCPWDMEWRPKVIILEACKPCTDIPCHEDWEDILTENGYTYHATCGVNRVYTYANKHIS